jgi:hypothetical protein
MLWLLFFLLPVFGGLVFIIIDRRGARLEAYDDDGPPADTRARRAALRQDGGSRCLSETSAPAADVVGASSEQFWTD